MPTSRSHAIVSSVQPCQAAFGPLQCNSSWSEPILSESRVHTHAWRLPLCPAWWFGIEEVEVLSGLHQVIGLALPSHTQPILSCKYKYKYKYRHQLKCRCHVTGLAGSSIPHPTHPVLQIQIQTPTQMQVSCHRACCSSIPCQTPPIQT